MRHLLDDHIEHFIRDVFDVIAFLLTLQPLQHLLFVLQVSFVQCWYSFLEVEHAGNLFDTVFLRFLRVVDLHEDYPQLIALVVDIFQFVENLLRFSVVVVV